MFDRLNPTLFDLLRAACTVAFPSGATMVGKYDHAPDRVPPRLLRKYALRTPVSGPGRYPRRGGGQDLLIEN